MASKLQCEICGGKLVGKPGGIFECENCGTEYSTEWAKAKIQEITGTVKVEGTVEVTGKVQIDGPVKVEGGANKEALLQRGMMALEESKWDDAKDYFNQALNYDAEFGEAYLGLAMAEARCQTKNEYVKAYTLAESPLRDSVNIRRARKYGASLAGWFASIDAEASKADEALRVIKERESSRLNPIRQRCAPASKMISAGSYHTVALRINGTVLATEYSGDNRYNFGQCDVENWTDVVAIAAGWNHTVGLKEDGTVLAVGEKKHGRCNVGKWRSIVAIAAGAYHTVGLKADGTVVAVGSDEYGQCQINCWRDIVAVAAGDGHTIGLKSDGTVVAVGNKLSGACEVEGWRNIVAIAASMHNSVGLKADGTVITAGDNICGKCNVEEWKDIVAIAAGNYHTVGLKADGTVVAVGCNQKVTDYGQCEVRTWSNVVAIATGSNHTIGLKANGTVISTKYSDSISYTDYLDYYHGQCEVSDWKLFNNVNTIESERKTAMGLARAERKAVAECAAAERKAAAEKAETARKAKIAALNKEKADLQAELPTIKGLFSGGKRRQLEAHLAEIEEELKKLK